MSAELQLALTALIIGLARLVEKIPKLWRKQETPVQNTLISIQDCLTKHSEQVISRLTALDDKFTDKADTGANKTTQVLASIENKLDTLIGKVQDDRYSILTHEERQLLNNIHTKVSLLTNGKLD